MNWPNANRPTLCWLVAVSALSAGLAAGHALADGRGELPSITVSYADLDLSKQAGAEALYNRIQAAARSVCGRVDSRDLERFTRFRQCYGETIEGALKQVNHSGLYAVHEQKLGVAASG